MGKIKWIIIGTSAIINLIAKKIMWRGIGLAIIIIVMFLWNDNRIKKPKFAKIRR